MLRTTQALDREWHDHHEHSDAGATALTRWATMEPALRGLNDLGDVLDRRRDSDRSEPVLAALARLAPTEPLAARTLLQALLPGIVTMSRRRFVDDPDAFEELTAIAWERIRTYPSDRPGAVAANVIVDVRKRYHAHRAALAPGEAAPVALGLAPSAEEVALSRLTVDDVVAAARSGFISDTALRLILRTRIDDIPLRHVAAEHDEDEGTLTSIRWRAERRLRQRLAEVA
jgi:hypothetical protein